MRNERRVALAAAVAVLTPGTVHAMTQRWAQAETMLEETVAVRPGGGLAVDIGDGDVDIRTRPGGGVEVEVRAWSRDPEWAREVFERMEFAVGTRGNTVTVTAQDPRIRGAEWRRQGGLGIYVRITVPERFDLDVRTSDGDVVIGDVTGTVVVRTSDGDVTVGDVTGPELSVVTSDGDVFARAIRAERTTLRTNDGDVDVEVASGSLNIRTNDGDIEVGFAAVGGVSLHTGDGDITMYAPADLSADLSLEGEDLHLDRDIQVVGRLSRRSIRGRLNGGGPEITVRTGDGTVSLRRR